MLVRPWPADGSSEPPRVLNATVYHHLTQSYLFKSFLSCPGTLCFACCLPRTTPTGTDGRSTAWYESTVRHGRWRKAGFLFLCLFVLR